MPINADDSVSFSSPDAFLNGNLISSPGSNALYALREESAAAFYLTNDLNGNCIHNSTNPCERVQIIELDPRLASDGVYMLSHDQTWNRTLSFTGDTQGPVTIGSQSSSWAQQQNGKMWSIDKTPVVDPHDLALRLIDGLQLLQQYNLAVQMHVRSLKDLENVAALALQYNVLDRVYFDMQGSDFCQEVNGSRTERLDCLEGFDVLRARVSNDVPAVAQHPIGLMVNYHPDGVYPRLQSPKGLALKNKLTAVFGQPNTSVNPPPVSTGLLFIGPDLTNWGWRNNEDMQRWGFWFKRQGYNVAKTSAYPTLSNGCNPSESNGRPDLAGRQGEYCFGEPPDEYWKNSQNYGYQVGYFYGRTLGTTRKIPQIPANIVVTDDPYGMADFLIALNNNQPLPTPATYHHRYTSLTNKQLDVTNPLTTTQLAQSLGGTLCANEGQTCVFYGSGTVNFGTPTSFDTLNAVTSIPCTVQAFGDDPAPGTVKQCWATQDQPGLPNGTYTIANRDSGLVLDMTYASLSAGASAQQYTYNGGGAQQWEVENVGNGYYTITNALSGLPLDNEGATSAGSGVYQFTSNNTPNQWWQINAMTDGSYTLQNVANSLLFSIAGGVATPGTPVSQQLGENTGQHWFFQAINNPNLVSTDEDLDVYTPPTGPTEFAGGVYTIANLASGQLLDVPYASTSSGVSIQQYPSDATAAQQWDIEKVDDNQYSIINVNSGLALDSGGQTAPGPPAVQATISGDSSQLWGINANADGTYSLVNTANNLTLSINGNSEQAGGLTSQVSNGNLTNSANWSMQPITTRVASGLYNIFSSNSALALSVASGSGSPNPQAIQDVSSSSSYAEQWYVNDLGNGFYAILNSYTGQLLDGAGGGSGSPIIQSFTTTSTKNDVTTNPNQMWSLNPNGDGTFILINRSTGLAATVQGGSVAAGAGLVQMNWSGLEEQEFSLQMKLTN